MKKFFGIILGVATLFGLYHIIYGIELNFPQLNQQSLVARFSEVHFNSPGNDFGGGIFWFTTQSLPETVTIQLSGSNNKVSCQKLVRGLYYNNQRGERLWPLDASSYNLLNNSGSGYENLSITGGLYTTCFGSGELYGIYGMITYKLGGTETYLVAGVKMDYGLNKFKNSFAHNLQYFNNVVPLGYFWDSVGGIAFVGGKLSGHQELITYLNNENNTINSAFVPKAGGSSVFSGSLSGWTLSLNQGGEGGSAKDTMWNILVQGNILLSKTINLYERKALLGNIEKRTIIISDSSLNSAQLINLAKKNADILCRGRQYYNGGTSELPINNNDKVLCYKDTTLNIDLSETDKYKNKTIIVNNGSIVLSGTMKIDSPPLDIFVNQGNLYLPTQLAEYESFNIEGFPTTNTGVNNGMFLKGTFLINGLLLAGGPDINNLSGFNHKLHLQGKISSLNTPTTPTQARIDQVAEMFSVLPTGYINLENIFTWECGLNGIGSDGTSCNSQSTISTTPFVVLNGNFPSNILK